MNNEMERELGWDDEIEKDSGEFILLPEGDYNFTITKFERGRFNGSDKMPACNQAKLELTIHSPEYGDVTVFHTLFLHTKTEGLLSNFFAGIGQKKKGERARMNWNAVVGSRGKCEIKQNHYTTKGEERVNNKVHKFYDYEEAFGSATQQYQAPVQQPMYQQPAPQQFQQPQYQQQQMPFPTAQSAGFTPGKF